MQCPNCKMNVKADSKFCIYCGSQFVAPPPVVENPSVVCPSCNMMFKVGTNFCTNCGRQISNIPPNQQIPHTPVQTVQAIRTASPEEAKATREEQEKYLKAYFGSSYNKVSSSSFSLGAFFLGWFWFLIYKLYGLAGKLLLTEIGISFAAGLLKIFLGNVAGVLGSAASLYVSYLYAQNFSSAYLDRANHEIDDILRSTTNEEERLSRCKKAGGPSIPAIIIGVIVVITVLSLTFYLSYKSTHDALENSRKFTFANTATMYVNSMKNWVIADEIICGNAVSKVEPGIYYYSFTTASGESATKLLDQGGKSPWKGSDVAGQIIIHKYLVNGIANYDYGIVLVDAEGRGFGEFANDGSVLTAIDVSSLTIDAVQTTNTDNRKVFFDIASSGTSNALNSVGPTLDTTLGKRPLKELTNNNGKEITKEPVACEYFD